MKEPQLRDLLGELDVEVTHTTSDGWLRCVCPFAEFTHLSGKDRDPSFFVKIAPSKLSGFHCFTCHEKGRMSTLVRKLARHREEDYGNLAILADLAETPDSFEDYEARGEFDIDPDPISKAAYLTMYSLAAEDPKADAYLERRGISQETAMLLQLLYDPDEMRILFPVFDFRKELYGFSGRSILSDKEIDDLNNRGRYRTEYRKIRDYTGLPKEKLLLGEHLIDPKKPLWIVEGLFAFAHMIEIGMQVIANPIATLGSRMSSYQKDLIVDYNVPAYLAYDNDAAGEIGIYGPAVTNEEGEIVHEGGGALDLLSPHVPTFIPLYPEGVNDPDGLTLDQVREMIENPE